MVGLCTLVSIEFLGHLIEDCRIYHAAMIHCTLPFLVCFGHILELEVLLFPLLTIGFQHLLRRFLRLTLLEQIDHHLVQR